MNDTPQVWHYGLMAEVWAQFLVDTPELDFYQKQIEQSGQPALDLACGAGRLLLPLLRLGIDIDGCDISADMIRHCQEKAAREGLAVRLYTQPMHLLDLPRRYKTIYICGSFGLGGSRKQDLQTLQGCYTHLDPGGRLVFNIEAEYSQPETWQDWLAEKRHAFPQPWPQQGLSRQAADGTEYVSRFRLVELNPLEQSLIRQVRLEKWQGGTLIATEEYTLKGNMYFKTEVELMLKVAGFADVAVLGDYTEESATPEHKELVFVAHK